MRLPQASTGRELENENHRLRRHGRDRQQQPAEWAGDIGAAAAGILAALGASMAKS